MMFAEPTRDLDILDRLPVGVVMCGGDGEILFANRAASRLMGGKVTGDAYVPGGSSLHSSDGTPISPQDLPIPRALSTRSAVRNVELLVRHSDGRERIVSATVEPDITPDGTCRGALCVLQDITTQKQHQERKRAEEKTRLNQQRLDLLARASSRLLTEDNPQSVLQSLCEQVLVLLDAQVFFNYLVKEDEAAVLQLNAYSGVDQGKAKGIERLERGQAICGTVAWQAHSIVVEKVQESIDARTEIIRELGLRSYACFPLLYRGEVLGTLSFGAGDRDRFEPEELSFIESFANQVAIALGRAQVERELLKAQQLLEQKVAERTSQLRRRSELLEAVIDNIPVMLTYYRPSLQFLLVNREFERLTGWSRMELEGLDLMRCVYPDEADRLEAERFMTRASGEWHDFVLTTRSGGRLESSWANVRLSDGSNIGIGLDTRDRKAAERKMQELNRALSQRTVELQELALELSEAEHKERRRLARLLHDDLQQMLFAAKLKISFLSKAGKVDFKSLEGLAQVESLLQDSIRASRSLTFELNPPVLDEEDFRRILAWLAETMVDRYQFHVDVSAEETLNLPPSLRRFLFEAVRELLFNAVKHSGAKNVSVSARQDDGAVRIEIRDSGHGFEPLAVVGSKAGFGLYSIRERIRLFGGQFHFTTAPGEGSHFTLTVPLDPEASTRRD